MDKEEKKIFREKRENLWRNNEKKSFLMWLSKKKILEFLKINYTKKNDRVRKEKSETACFR